MYIYIYMHICVYPSGLRPDRRGQQVASRYIYVHIHICIYRERERERDCAINFLYLSTTRKHLFVVFRIHGRLHMHANYWHGLGEQCAHTFDKSDSGRIYVSEINEYIYIYIYIYIYMTSISAFSKSPRAAKHTIGSKSRWEYICCECLARAMTPESNSGQACFRK